MPARNLTGDRLAPKTPERPDVADFHVFHEPPPTRYWTSNRDPVLDPRVAHVTVKGRPDGAEAKRGGTRTVPRMFSACAWHT